jgi:hypothetical protein
MLVQEIPEPAFWCVDQAKLSRIAMRLLLFLLRGLVVATKLLLELLDPTHRVDKLLLAGEVGMRGAGNVDVDDGVFITVFPLDRLLRRHGRPCQKLEVSLLVDKNNRTVIGMDIDFNNQFSLVSLIRNGGRMPNGRPNYSSSLEGVTMRPR